MPYKNPETQKIFQSEWHKARASKRKQIFNEFFETLFCQICSENTKCCLDFHHVDETMKEFGVMQRLGTYGLDKVLKEIEKCAVLCSNCHRKYHAGLFPDHEFSLVVVPDYLKDNLKNV